jgi:hypothetical protein
MTLIVCLTVLISSLGVFFWLIFDIRFRFFGFLLKFDSTKVERFFLSTKKNIDKKHKKKDKVQLLVFMVSKIIQLYILIYFL